MFCTCCIVFRECARATQVVNLASAELYVLGDILKSYTGSHTWKHLNVNCGGYIRQWRL